MRLDLHDEFLHPFSPDEKSCVDRGEPSRGEIHVDDGAMDGRDAASRLGDRFPSSACDVLCHPPKDIPREHAAVAVSWPSASGHSPGPRQGARVRVTGRLNRGGAHSEPDDPEVPGGNAT
jgi:hypothetical protein